MVTLPTMTEPPPANWPLRLPVLAKKNASETPSRPVRFANWVNFRPCTSPALAPVMDQPIESPISPGPLSTSAALPLPTMASMPSYCATKPAVFASMSTVTAEP